MAANDLKPMQDLIVREFFLKIATQEDVLPDAAASLRQLRAICLKMLNYSWLPNGAFIEAGTNISLPFGSTDYSAFPDEWEADARRAHEAVTTKAYVKTSASSKSTDTPVWKAILSKDV